MDFLKRFLKNVLPVNQIIKFIIKQFLSSYLVIKENDLEEKAQDDSGLKNLISINDLELNVSNINQKHLLHSPIKLLRGKLGKFSLDITEENKIIISIEDVSIDLMPIFNYYKKYQETIFDMKKKKEEVKTQGELENKNSAGVAVDKTGQPNPKNQNNYMLNMANKLLTNLEINIKNISIKLFTYEIGQKIMENPVFSIFIMNINVFKNEKIEKKESIVDPNTKQPFEEIFLNNLVINVDKLCLKVDQNLNEKDNREFKELKNICNNEKLTKAQEEKILSFFIAYNTIFAMNYKKGPCLSIKLNTKARIEKLKDSEKIVEDMNVQIDIFEAESIITPHQLFNIQILSQISNFIFTLNKNTPNKEDEIQQKKSEDKKYGYIPVENENENEKKDNKDEATSSGVFNKDKNKEIINIDKKDLKVSYLPFENEEENANNNLEKKEEKNMDILGHEISKFNITMNAIRIILVLLENNNNESIPKLFSFLMEDEIESQKKNNKNANTNSIDFDKSNKSFENYYCYYEDNILFLKIESIKSVNNEINSSINVSSVITEYIKSNIPNENKNKNKKDEKTVLKKKQQNSQLEASIYESMNEYDDFHEVGSDNEDMFESALENTEFLVMENYHKYISKFIDGEYTSNKFEILIINDINFDMTKNILDIKEILINLNYIIILLYIKLFNQVNFFIDSNKPMYKNEDFIMPTEDIEENLNVNLEKKINDSELQLLKNLEKNHKNKKSSNNNNNDNKEEDNMEISVDDSIDYSEEEKNKKNGMKINLKYISIKIYNITKDISRFDTNIYYYKLFLELIYPNISSKINDNVNEHYEEQSLKDLISKDFLEIVLNDMNMNFYSVSNTSKINITFQEILFKYWNYIVIQYTNISKKNKIDENPNVAITTPGNDIIVDFSDKIRINLEKNILDDLLTFNNTFLYGLSMYQIFDKYCGDLYNNKIINLFDMFGIKSHYVLLKKLNLEEDIPLNQNNNVKKEKNRLEEIKKELNNKPSISIGGRIASCVININKNGTFEEKEGNLMKIKIVNIGVNLDMFSDDNNGNNEKKEPVYNNVTISINNIYFLIKEHTIPKEGKAKYYNIFSKNKIPKFESIDYFLMSFKFRNMKKIKDNIIIEEEENEAISDNENENEKNEKEGSLKKKNSKFDINNSKIILSPKTKEYIAFILNNQIKLDNMEMVVDIKISELVIDSFYHKLYILSSTLSDFFIEFTAQKEEKNLEGTYLQSSDLIPLCEDRLMIIKLDFNINHLFLDIFLKEDKDQKNWMRLLLLVDTFKFTFNETGIFLDLNNNYIYIMKDFNYIYHIKSNNNNNLFDVEDKISDIHKEDSYLKRLGYVELFYNDKIKLEKTEKESNINLGNINLFLCKDSFDFILLFIEVFTENYLEKIKDIFSQDTLNSDDSNEEIEKQVINKQKNKKEKKEEKKKDKNEKEDKNKKEEKLKEKKDNEFVSDFEVVDDIFFMDNIKKNEDKSKKNPKSKYLENNPNTLRTIPEENSLKTKKSKDEFHDDFTIIETKSSLERKNLRKKKEEESVKYLLELDSLRLYIFSGSDFNFEDDTKNDLDLTDVQNQENKEKAEDDKEDQDDIDKNYLFKYSYQKKPKNKKILQINKRKKIEERDYKNYILLNIINLSFKIIGFSYFDFIIDNFFIDDNFDKSQYNKIISKQDFSRDSKFLVCKFEISPHKEVNKNKNVEYLRIYLTLPSLDILVDQLPLTFIIKFILSRNYDKNKENKDKENDEINNDKNNKDAKNEDDIEKINSKDSWEDEDLENDKDLLIFINDISINSFMINFHYNSHKISYKKLISNREWIELLNGLGDIKDLNFKFKKYTKNIQTPLTDVIDELISLWKDDILQNQLADSILRGLTITRPFYKLYDGIKDLVVQPYLSYKKNEGIKKGFKKGMKSFFVSFSSQGLLFGEKIFRGMKIVAFRKTKLSLKKKSLYKTWVYKINKKQHEYEMHYYK